MASSYTVEQLASSVVVSDFRLGNFRSGSDSRSGGEDPKNENLLDWNMTGNCGEGGQGTSQSINFTMPDIVS